MPMQMNINCRLASENRHRSHYKGVFRCCYWLVEVKFLMCRESGAAVAQSV
jgi:hypothetical protein